jgi:DNA-binding transcriptional LysR family regulator
MKNLDIKSLRLFIAVCESGNLKSAAEQEHIEPSAVSKRLASLELSCGAKLFTRSRNGAKPTTEGQVLLEHARSILFTLNKAEADLAAFKSGVQGQVRLVASASAIAESLLDDVAKFMRHPDHQQIQVDIEEKNSPGIIHAVREGHAPMGICWDNLDLDGLSSRPYKTDELVLAVPTNHPLCHQNSVLFEDTLEFEHVGLPTTTAVYSMLQRSAIKSGKRLTYRLVVSNFDSAFRVVAAGLGISVVPREVGQLYVDNRLVSIVPLENSWSQRQFVILYRSMDEITPAARQLLEFLTNQSEPFIR